MVIQQLNDPIVELHNYLNTYRNYGSVNSIVTCERNMDSLRQSLDF